METGLCPEVVDYATRARVASELRDSGPGREIGGPAADRYDVGAILRRPPGHAPPESGGRAGDEPGGEPQV